MVYDEIKNELTKNIQQTIREHGRGLNPIEQKLLKQVLTDELSETIDTFKLSPTRICSNCHREYNHNHTLCPYCGQPGYSIK